MARTSMSIEIPVNIQAQVNNIKNLRTSLVNAINSAGKESSLAKTLTKDLSKLEPIIRNIENIALSPTIDAQGIRTLEKLFENFYNQINKSFTQIDLSSFEQIAGSQEIEHLKTLTTEAEKYRKEIEAIKEATKSSISKEHEMELSDEDMLEAEF